MAELPVEPWLRGTLTDIGSVHRGVLHALELAQEDIPRWCGELTDRELNDRPHDLPSIAFQLRHTARSLDRLLSYAEGKQLTEEQTAALQSESNPDATHAALFAEFRLTIEHAIERVKALTAVDLGETRAVGRRQLPTTVGGLLVHVADHTQRHVGQAVTTAKVIVSMH